jgi:tyrosyl-tRNA synthetase
VDIEEQLAILTQGAIDVIPEAELRRKLAEGRPLRVKLGIDPTASDIHLGFAVVLRKLRQFQDLGHLAVLILGDFTAQVGDPSGRSATRPSLSKAEVDEHAASYVEQITQILDPVQLEIRRNSEWLGEMSIDDVLRLTARTTVARMLERDDFAKRYASGTPISLTEFLYPLLQGWDSVMVHADVELGGTDQLFNLLVGRQLQEQEDQSAQIVLTTPLLEGLSGGAKMSKSLGNYVGIAESAQEQFGKLYSIPDDLIPMYLQYTTAWPQAKIDEVTQALAVGGLKPNEAKRILARAVVDLYHGDGAGVAAEAEFDRIFKSNQPPSEIPEIAADPAWGSEPVRLAAVLVHCGLATSNKDGRRKIEQGGVRIDGDIVGDPDLTVVSEQLLGKVLQAGKRNWARLVNPG